MRKIIQILYDHTMKRSTPVWLALCEDGSVWRQKLVEDPIKEPPYGRSLMIVDPKFHTEWERVQEFDQIPKEWTPDDENERGR